jgi:UDP-N-acetylmuramoyl-tripeptide--D-alanyl-D-alanine ligase
MKFVGPVHMALYRAKIVVSAVAGRFLSFPAAIYRRCLRRSCGKSTTVRLIDHLLAPLETRNVADPKSKTVLNTALGVLALKPWARYCVYEFSGHRPGALDPFMWFFRPQISVVTNIADDHINDGFGGSRENIAREKSKIVACLPADGTAILNMDDPHVSGMAERTRGRVVFYGHSKGADFRTGDVRSVWPDRLSMVVHYNGQSVAVDTQMIGEQWAHAVLAAIAVAMSCGVSVEQCVRRLATFEPVQDRMQPIVLDGDITVISDSYKGAYTTVPAFLRVVATARAPRKIVVFGALMYIVGPPKQAYAEAIGQALATADLVYFVGPETAAFDDFDPGEGRDRYRAFPSLRDLNDHLREVLQPGDVVFLKGRRRNSHLERLVLDRKEGVVCWREKCEIINYCRNCRGWRVPADPGNGVID